MDFSEALTQLKSGQTIARDVDGGSFVLSLWHAEGDALDHLRQPDGRPVDAIPVEHVLATDWYCVTPVPL